MTKFISLIKRNLLLTICILVIAALVYLNLNEPHYLGRTVTMGTPMMAESNIAMDAGYAKSIVSSVAPTPQKERLTVTDTDISMVTKNVSDSITKITQIIKQYDGYLVNSNLTNPQESASGTISIRLPFDKLGDVLPLLKATGIKIVFENLNGTDVTDQYVDYQARLDSLNATKQKFDSLLAKADNVSEIMEIQNQILNLQTQIDTLIGQQKYLEQTAKLALITIHLSTDEFSLPYAPTEAWRPEVIFKTAVRSLVLTLRHIGTLAIWTIVYLPIPIIGYLIYLIVQKLPKRLSKLSQH